MQISLTPYWVEFFSADDIGTPTLGRVMLSEFCGKGARDFRPIGVGAMFSAANRRPRA